jgi:RNA polymerase sigma factor (sigma-70 family)
MKYIYQRDVDSVYNKFTKEQQIGLHAQIKNGDDDARMTVIHSCLPLVIDIAKKFRFNNKHIELEDFIQEGNIALIRAVDNWDVAKGNITTVATWYIRNSFIDMINDARYSIKTAVSFTRRAAEDLRKIKNVDSSNPQYISEETGLAEKRVRKLLSCCPRGQTRVSTDNINSDDFFNEDDEPEERPCLADLVAIVDTSLPDNQRTIFSFWAGISKKKMGIKEIANYLGMTPQYVYDNLKAAQRTLKRIARENKKCQSSM